MYIVNFTRLDLHSSVSVCSNLPTEHTDFTTLVSLKSGPINEIKNDFNLTLLIYVFCYLFMIKMSILVCFRLCIIF